MTAYAADTWLSPVVLDSTNNVIVVTQDPGGGGEAVIICTLDVGTYYLHDDSGFHATKKGLLYAIQKLLNDGTTAGVGSVSGSPTYLYSWECSTPTGSAGLTNNGLILRATAPAADFEISWTHASTTLDAQLLGEPLSTPILDTGSATDTADQIIEFAQATRHRMVTRDMGTGEAVDKRKTHYKDVRFSSQRPSDSVAVVWDEGYYRVIRYEDVPGVEVHDTRANDADWAGITGRATGDTQAVWWDVWDTLSVGMECIIVHDSSSDLQVDTHDYEVVKLWEPTAWDQFAQQQAPSGDYYTVEVAVWVDPAASSYGH